MRRVWVVGVLVGALTALLAGCGAKGETESAEQRRGLQEVKVALNGYEGAENAGLLMAYERGYFDDVGLYAVLTQPVTPQRPLGYVTSRLVDLGISQQPQVVLAKEKEAPVISVGSLISQPTAAMIWLKGSKIDGIADLKGKTIAIPGVPFQRSFLLDILARAGLTPKDVRIEVAGYELVSALVKGRADAIFGGSANLEGAALESRGLKPVIARAQSLGIPSYDELTVIVRPDFLSRHRQLVRNFMSAVARGTAAAIEDPKAVAELIEESQESNPDLSRKATEAQVAATLPLLSGNGYMDPDQAAELVEWMRTQGLIRREPSVPELLTNDYLASPP